MRTNRCWRFGDSEVPAVLGPSTFFRKAFLKNVLVGSLSDGCVLAQGAM